MKEEENEVTTCQMSQIDYFKLLETKSRMKEGYRPTMTKMVVQFVEQDLLKK